MRPMLFMSPVGGPLHGYPRLSAADKFQEWSNGFLLWASTTNVEPLISMTAEASWQMDKEQNFVNNPINMLEASYRQLHKRLTSTMQLAINQLMPTTIDLGLSIKSSNNPTRLVYGSLLQPEEDAHVWWTAIRNVYQQTSSYSLVTTWQQILALKFDPNKEPLAIINEFNNLNERLNRAVGDEKPQSGNVLVETQKCVLILNALPESFNTDKAVLFSQTKLTVDAVRSMLVRAHEKKQVGSSKKQQQQQQQLSEQANLTHTNQQQQNKNKQKGKKDWKKNPPKSTAPSGDHEMFLVELPDEPEQQEHVSSDHLLVHSISDERRSQLWCLDSGATRHVTVDPRCMFDCVSIPTIRLYSATGHSNVVRETGSVRLTTNVVIKGVAHMPGATVNLLSVSRITKAGYRAQFFDDGAIIRAKAPCQDVILRFKLEAGLYVMTRASKAGQQLVNPPASEGLSIQRRPNNNSSNNNSKSQPPSAAATSRTELENHRATRSKHPATAASIVEVDEAYSVVEQPAPPTQPPPAAAASKPTAATQQDQQLHERYGHQSIYPMDGCELAITRSKRTPISKKQPYVSSTRPLQSVSADLMGPFSSHSDGASQAVPSLGGNRYALVVVDDYSRHTWVRLLKNKSDAADATTTVLQLAATQLQAPVIRLHTDGGGEFLCSKITEFVAANGIRHTYTTRDHPEHNGKVERLNQTLMLMVRSMLTGCNAPLALWGEALAYAAIVYNRTPLRVIDGVSPHEKLHGVKPDLSKLHVFGSNCFHRVVDAHRAKLDPPFVRGVWVGYSEQQSAHRVLTKEYSIISTRDAKVQDGNFDFLPMLTGEDDLPLPSSYVDWSLLPLHLPQPSTNVQQQPSSSTSTSDTLDNHQQPHNAAGNDIEMTDSNRPADGNHMLPPVQFMYSEPAAPVPDHQSMQEQADDAPDMSYMSGTDSSSDDEPAETRLIAADRRVSTPITVSTTTRSGRAVRPPVRYGMVARGDVYTADQPESLLLLSNQQGTAISDPTNWKEAMRHPDANEYHKDAQGEIGYMRDSGVYTLVNRRPGMRIITSRWVVKAKRDANNKIIAYKTRLVARGFEQRHGVDYDATFAPVAGAKSIRIILALAAQHQLKLYQLDVRKAFLNAKLDEDVYMQQPEGFADGTDRVWKLHRAIYGLKQSPRVWNQELDSTINKIGYQRSQVDPCVYYRTVPGYAVPMMLSIYVDDIVAAYHPNLHEQWLKDKQMLSDSYDLSDIGDVKWLLNMAVCQSPDRRSITISQNSYVQSMLERFSMMDAKGEATPATGVDLTDPKQQAGEPLSKEQHNIYRQLVGSLLYAANTTRLDISHSVAMLSRFVQAPTTQHLHAARRVLRYLKTTADHKLKFVQQTDTPAVPPILAYSDADWAGDKTDRKSTSGSVVQLYGCTISWSSKKQSVVALSSMESELIALCSATTETLWIQKWIRDVLGQDTSITVLVDNQATIASQNNETTSERSKHIDIRHFFVRDLVLAKRVKLDWVSTTEQLADILTKSLARISHSCIRDRLMAE